MRGSAATDSERLRPTDVHRGFVSSLVGALLVLSSSAAVAEPGQVVLVGGQVVTGDLQKVVKGDYIIIVLPNGDVKAIAWADIQSFGFSGGGAAEATPPPAPNTSKRRSSR